MIDTRREAELMPMVQIMGYRCERCGHQWRPRGGDPDDQTHPDPKVCPNCKSAWWDVPKKDKAEKTV